MQVCQHADRVSSRPRSGVASVRVSRGLCAPEVGGQQVGGVPVEVVAAVVNKPWSFGDRHGRRRLGRLGGESRRPGLR